MGAQQNLIVALAQGLSQQQAAAVGGVSVRTLQRRAQEPGFSQAVRDTRSAMLDQCVGKMARAAADAADVLQDLLTQGKPDKIRLAAARAILELFPRLQQLQEFDQRLAALEQRIDGEAP